jgi:8-oxo-dGTP pyrophosphatase MutT (NUDIX family)
MVPKGWPIPGLQPHESAAREAFEEAGVVGHVHPKPLGSFEYLKGIGFGRRVKCTVEVFPLEVYHQRRYWLERGERETKWFNVEKAAGLVLEPTLKRILLHFDPYALLSSDEADLQDGRGRS